MTRVYVICEGASEESFVNVVLSPYLANFGVYIYAKVLGKHAHQGGNITGERLLKDCRNFLMQENNVYVTTLIDYYGSLEGFLGKEEAKKLASNEEKIEIIKAYLIDELKSKFGVASNRFLPYVQMHEFEALLFSDVNILHQKLNTNLFENPFINILEGYETPEHINNSPITAPSKRILKHYNYKKVVDGTRIASSIGVETMMKKCPGFNKWIESLKLLS